MVSISVIITVYNIPDPLLIRCLESLKRQSRHDVEFIIVNDGSTQPECEKTILSFCGCDNRFRYIFQENQGVSVARNNGISASSGEYIMFVDGDDSITDGALDIAYSKMQESGADCIIFGYNELQKDFKIVKTSITPYRKSLNHAEIENLILDIISFETSEYRQKNINVDSPWSKIFKSQIIKDKNIRFNTSLSRSEDALFCIQYYDNCDIVNIDSESIYNYTYNGYSICRSDSDIIIRMLPNICVNFKQYLFSRQNSNTKTINSLCLLVEKYLLMSEEQYFFSPTNTKSTFKLLKEYCQLLSNEDIRVIINDTSHQMHRSIGAFHRLAWITPICIPFFLIMRIRSLIALR